MNLRPLVIIVYISWIIIMFLVLWISSLNVKNYDWSAIADTTNSTEKPSYSDKCWFHGTPDFIMDVFTSIDVEEQLLGSNFDVLSSDSNCTLPKLAQQQFQKPYCNQTRYEWTEGFEERREVFEKVDLFRKRFSPQERLNVIMIAMESVSRADMMRIYPQLQNLFYEYSLDSCFRRQTENDKDVKEFSHTSFVFNRMLSTHHKTTCGNLFPALAGVRHTLANDRLRQKYAYHLGRSGLYRNLTWMWDHYNSFGYITGVGCADGNCFGWGNGEFSPFNTVDYLLEPYPSNTCDHATSKYGLNWLVKFIQHKFTNFTSSEEVNPEIERKFAFIMLREYTLHSVQLHLDETLVDTFRTLMKNESNVVIFVSDHGANRQYGAPFLGLFIPNWVLGMRPTMLKHLWNNQLKTVSWFDVHWTLANLATFPGKSNYDCQECPVGTKPLYEEQRCNRTCEELGVESPVFCACSEHTVPWRPGANSPSPVRHAWLGHPSTLGPTLTLLRTLQKLC